MIAQIQASSQRDWLSPGMQAYLRDSQKLTTSRLRRVSAWLGVPPREMASWENCLEAPARPASGRVSGFSIILSSNSCWSNSARNLLSREAPFCLIRCSTRRFSGRMARLSIPIRSTEYLTRHAASRWTGLSSGRSFCSARHRSAQRSAPSVWLNEHGSWGNHGGSKRNLNPRATSILIAQLPADDGCRMSARLHPRLLQHFHAEYHCQLVL